MIEGVNGSMLIVTDNGWGILASTCQPVNAVGYTILWCDGRHGDMMMPELQSIGDTGALGLLGDDMLAAVMIVNDPNVPRCLATIVP